MFSIDLNISSNVDEQMLSNSSLSESSMDEILMEICNEFNCHSSIIRFSIVGFDKDWSNIDIESDLCMLMEDMPALVEFIKNKDIQELQFGFPEQHIQRILTIIRVSSGVKISCSDWLSENPEVKEELMKTEEFMDLIRQLVQKIQLAVDRICPSAYENKFFKDWLQQVQI